VAPARTQTRTRSRTPTRTRSPVRSVSVLVSVPVSVSVNADVSGSLARPRTQSRSRTRSPPHPPSSRPGTPFSPVIPTGHALFPRHPDRVSGASEWRDLPRPHRSIRRTPETGRPAACPAREGLSRRSPGTQRGSSSWRPPRELRRAPLDRKIPRLRGALPRSARDDGRKRRDASRPRRRWAPRLGWMQGWIQGSAGAGGKVGRGGSGAREALSPSLPTGGWTSPLHLFTSSPGHGNRHAPRKGRGGNAVTPRTGPGSAGGAGRRGVRVGGAG